MFNRLVSNFFKSMFACMASIFFLGACSKNDDNDLLITQEFVKNDVKTNLNATLILQLINEQRSKGCNCGSMAMQAVPNLVWNDLLAQASLSHSTDMNNHNFLDHVSSNGASLSERVEAVGYKWSALAENIAKGQKSEQEVIDSWFKSEGHCKNLMSAKYKEIGAARVNSYWTLDFGTQIK